MLLRVIALAQSGGVIAGFVVLAVLIVQWQLFATDSLTYALVNRTSVRGKGTMTTALKTASIPSARLTSAVRLQNLSQIYRFPNSSMTAGAIDPLATTFYTYAMQMAAHSTLRSAYEVFTVNMTTAPGSNAIGWGMSGCVASSSACFQAFIGLDGSSTLVKWSRWFLASNLSHVISDPTVIAESTAVIPDLCLAGAVQTWRTAFTQNKSIIQIVTNPMTTPDEFMWSSWATGSKDEPTSSIASSVGAFLPFPNNAFAQVRVNDDFACRAQFDIFLASTSCVLVDSLNGCRSAIVAQLDLQMLQELLEATTPASISMLSGMIQITSASTLGDILVYTSPPWWAPGVGEAKLHLQTAAQLFKDDCPNLQCERVGSTVFYSVDMIYGVIMSRVDDTSTFPFLLVTVAQKSSFYSVWRNVRTLVISISVPASLLSAAFAVLSILVLANPLTLLRSLVERAGSWSELETRIVDSVGDDKTSDRLQGSCCSLSETTGPNTSSAPPRSPKEDASAKGLSTTSLESMMVPSFASWTFAVALGFKEIADLYKALRIVHRRFVQVKKFVPQDLMENHALMSSQTDEGDDAVEMEEAVDDFSFQGLFDPSAIVDRSPSQFHLDKQRAIAAASSTNHFRELLCTVLRVSLPLPPSLDIEDINATTADFMNAVIASILEYGGTVDQQLPGEVVAYFVGTVDGNRNDLSNPLSSLSLKSWSQAIDPSDRQRGPVAAVLCAMAIRKRFSVAFAQVNANFFIHTGKFLFGNFGSKQRLARVLFSPKFSWRSTQLGILNAVSLRESIIVTSRAARTIGTTFARAGVLNEKVVIFPVDYVVFQRGTSDQLVHPEPGQAEQQQECVQLFSIAELVDNASAVRLPDAGGQRLSGVPAVLLKEVLRSWFTLFAGAYHGAQIDAATEASAITPAVYPLLKLKELLTGLKASEAYEELSRHCRRIRKALESSAKMYISEALQKRHGDPLIQYRRCQTQGWPMFGLPLLGGAPSDHVKAHIGKLRSAGVAVRSRDSKKLLSLPSARSDAPDLSTVPHAMQTVDYSEGRAAAQPPKVPESCRAHVASVDEEGGFALFDVYLPSSNAQMAFPVPKPTAALESDAKGISGYSSTTPTSHSSATPMTHPVADPSTSVTTIPGELPRIIKDNNETWWLRSDDSVGCGSFSTVYPGLSNDGTLVALKCVSLLAQHIVPKDLEQEVNTACGLNHDNIVKYHGWVLSQEHLVIVMEFIAGGSLKVMMDRFGSVGIPSFVTRKYARDCLMGLSFLHSNSIVHCDVKPHNVLVSLDGVAKLADFGSVILDAFGVSVGFSLRGTALYMAPEVAKGEKPSAASDIFSFGVLLHEMATGGELPWMIRKPTAGAFQALSESEKVTLTMSITRNSAATNVADLASTFAQLQGTVRKSLVASVSKRDDVAMKTIIAGDPLLQRQHVFIQFLAVGVIGTHIRHPTVANNPPLRAIIESCLREDPALRPTAAQLLAIEYFSSSGGGGGLPLTPTA